MDFNTTMEALGLSDDERIEFLEHMKPLFDKTSAQLKPFFNSEKIYFDGGSKAKITDDDIVKIFNALNISHYIGFWNYKKNQDFRDNFYAGNTARDYKDTLNNTIDKLQELLKYQDDHHLSVDLENIRTKVLNSKTTFLNKSDDFTGAKNKLYNSIKKLATQFDIELTRYKIEAIQNHIHPTK